jgi:D-3-phosphoglycerate dehydrogenase / 2-oxoglutarate reductase
MKSLRILVAEPLDFSPEAVRILETVGQVELRGCSVDDFKSALKEYDVCLFRLGYRVDRKTLNGDLRCRVLATPVTGLDHIDLEACFEHGIQVISLHGETDFLKNVRATAELTLALSLSLLRNIPAAVESVKQGVWDRDLFRGHELFGKTAGIVGMGRLGTIVAGYFQALGMKVLGYDPSSDFPHEVAQCVPTLGELLQAADLVSLHVPYNSSTRHLIGSAEFSAMKNGAFLVNTSRGGIIDETALLNALQSSRFAGAALDVPDGEPFVGDHPLVRYARDNPNLLIVPHIGGNTLESFGKTEVFLANRVAETLRVCANS